MALKTATSISNWARGQLDHDLNGRYELPIYKSGSEMVKNFYSNFHGNGIYRSGLEHIFTFQDCRFKEFKFNKTQSYNLVFFGTKLRFLSQASDGSFGWVLDSASAILEITTPYSLAESKELGFAQNADVMYITHSSHPPMKLTRVSANNFTIATFTITDDPFDSPSTGTVGYPALCTFYKARLYYGASTLKFTTVWGSKVGEYDVFTLPVTVTDESSLAVTLSEFTDPIEWLFAGNNSLIAGSSTGVAPINGGAPGDPITPSTVEATKTNTEGSNGTFPIRKDDLIFYIGLEGRNVFAFSYDILTESFKADDTNFASYDITTGGMEKLVYKKDKNDLLYTIRDGDMLTLNFNAKEEIVGWNFHETDGDIKDIEGLTREDGNTDLLVLVERDGVFHIERVYDMPVFKIRDFFSSGYNAAAKVVDDEAYARYTSEVLRGCNFLDNSKLISNIQTNVLTWDSTAGELSTASGVFSSGDVSKIIEAKTITGYEKGRWTITAYVDASTVEATVLIEPTTTTFAQWYLSFNEITTIDWLTDLEVTVVADGGYLGEFTFASDTLTLDRQVLTACVGRSYEGILKSFSLGFIIQGVNTQTTYKNVYSAGFRFVFSAGGEFGTSLYDMEEIQKLETSDYNYMPPQVMDGTRKLEYPDTAALDKYVYIRQRLPLPLIITSLVTQATYGVNQ